MGTPQPDDLNPDVLTFFWEGPRTQADMLMGLEAAVDEQRIGYVR